MAALAKIVFMEGKQHVALQCQRSAKPTDSELRHRTASAHDASRPRWCQHGAANVCLRLIMMKRQVGCVTSPAPSRVGVDVIHNKYVAAKLLAALLRFTVHLAHCGFAYCWPPW